MDSDVEYFRRRISEERALAAIPDLDSVRDFHRLLAEAYEQRLARSLNRDARVTSGEQRQTREHWQNSSAVAASFSSLSAGADRLSFRPSPPDDGTTVDLDGAKRA